ncbi:MAG: hypothetical protein M0R70_12635 [Nitrospirae bacterium]|nr:hypothetical protein [Nitrospirota bacterium]
MEEKQPFLDEILSDGTRASWGRLGSAIALLFVCAWISVLVWRVSDMAKELPALAIFIGAAAAFVTALYAVSKISDAVETVKTAKQAVQELPK